MLCRPAHTFALYPTRRPLPASVRIILQTHTLYAEDNDEAGRVLSLAFQLFDTEQRTAVETDGLRVLAVLTLNRTLADGSGGVIKFALPPCAIAAALPGSGVGSCRGTVPPEYFPDPGTTATAKVTVFVYTG